MNKNEDRRQKLEVRRQKSEVRRQKSGDRRQKLEVRSQKSELATLYYFNQCSPTEQHFFNPIYNKMVKLKLKFFGILDGKNTREKFDKNNISEEIMKTKFILFVTILLGLVILSGCQSQYMTTAKLAIRDEKNPDKAIKNLNLELETNPQNAEAYLLLSKVYGQFKSDYTKSFECAEKAVELDPGKKDEAENIYRTCWSQMHNAGVKNYQDEKYDDALVSIKEAHRVFPDSVQTIKMLANIYLKMDDPENASNYFKIIIEKEPKDISARKSLAQINFNKDKYEEAILYFKQLAELQPENVDWTYNIAACYSNAGEHEKSLEYYKITLKKDPKNLELVLKIANSEFNSQNYETAIKYYKKAIKLDPENIGAVEFCTRSFNFVKDYEGVLEYATKWKELDPNNKNAKLFIQLAKQKLGN